MPKKAYLVLEPYTGVYPLGSTKIGNKELYIVEGASHVDLYDNLDKIPFRTARKATELSLFTNCMIQ